MCPDAKEPPQSDRPSNREPPKSGEGAETALQALIRKRKLDPPKEDADPTPPPEPG